MRTAISNPRGWLAGPAAFLLAILLTLGMAVWFPAGPAQLNNIAMPLIAFPLIWAGVFFWAYLADALKPVALSFLLLAVAHIALLAWHFMAGAGA